ncbi:photosystem II cytochrome PsbV2 [Chroococcidiopsis sp. FACHB-1243]|uniref:photosystem II cytochrome PsbV2 n=1 Tax=Chroococcidiopsis sp. [FACHB-1243] TaxID=2692781 RepID=UPI00177EE277|nr:photosystem II cytochrome PsbV2 [Chroococcidiopsis sp. [FACHB-1243]]MBD2304111.1 photosystem II cytochrome PsbV2 [Chroococcidiopsis sp. [FACHB-1243]]
MIYRLFGCLFFSLIVCLGVLLLPSTPAQAAIDAYVARYLHVTEPIELEVSDRETRSFSPEEISQGKQSFSQSCQTCHVGGSTISFPEVSLSLEKLKGAMPSRDNINGLVAYMRKPMTYDGSEETYWCREVPESWLTQAQVENLAAFILTAAKKAPGWGTETF